MKTKVWQTDETGKTDVTGAFTTRGFHGDYEIVVQKDGVTKKLAATVDKSGKTLKVEL